MATLHRSDVQRLRRKLESERSAHLAQAREDLTRMRMEGIASLAGEVGDEADSAVAFSLADFESNVAQRHIDAIKAIDEALFRIRSHRFGSCADCAGQIDPGRLRAFPVATRCTACQRRYESTHAHILTPSL